MMVYPARHVSTYRARRSVTSVAYATLCPVSVLATTTMLVMLARPLYVRLAAATAVGPVTTSPASASAIVAGRDRFVRFRIAAMFRVAVTESASSVNQAGYVSVRTVFSGTSARLHAQAMASPCRTTTAASATLAGVDPCAMSTFSAWPLAARWGYGTVPVYVCWMKTVLPAMLTSPRARNGFMTSTAIREHLIATMGTPCRISIVLATTVTLCTATRVKLTRNFARVMGECCVRQSTARALARTGSRLPSARRVSKAAWVRIARTLPPTATLCASMARVMKKPGCACAKKDMQGLGATSVIVGTKATPIVLLRCRARTAAAVVSATLGRVCVCASPRTAASPAKHVHCLVLTSRTARTLCHVCRMKVVPPARRVSQTPLDLLCVCVRRARRARTVPSARTDTHLWTENAFPNPATAAVCIAVMARVLM
eukprot:Rmarinus@m.25158